MSGGRPGYPPAVMTDIETARGPLAADHLGVTLMHEHVFTLNTELQQNYPLGWDEDERMGDAVTKLTALKQRGVDTIVDPTVIGLGRYIPRIERLAKLVELNIVVATGLYTYNDVPFWFHYRGPGTLLDDGSIDPMATLFIGDIVDGVLDTSVKAAILKCATDEAGLTPGVERVLRAVARAHRDTGAPITTHTHAGTERGLDQQRVFTEEGVDLSHVVIGHSGDSTDLDYLKKLMDAGSTIGMDRFGVDVLLPFEDRVATVAALCQAGYADRMVLAHDAACFIDWFDEPVRQAMAPNWHYTHIHDDVLPALGERGVTDDQIRQMLVDTPRRILTPTQPY